MTTEATASKLDEAARTMELCSAALDHATGYHGGQDGPDLYRVAMAAADILKATAAECKAMASEA